MQQSPLQIGEIDLQSFEVPTSIRFGGRQRLAVHKLSDGTRTIERLGPDDGEIRFQGTFSGPDAQIRARALDSLRISGASVWLTWNSFRYLVIVANFLANYESSRWIPYRISCVVVQQAGVSLLQTASVQSLISADFSSAFALLADPPASMEVFSSAVTAENALVSGSDDHLQAVNAASASLNVLNSLIADQSGALVSSTPQFGHAPAYAASFSDQVTCAGSLAAAVNARSYIARIQMNLNAAGG